MVTKSDRDDPVEFDEDDELRSYASPPCYRHEIDSEYMGLPEGSGVGQSDTESHFPDAGDWASVSAWRRMQRARLVSQRDGLDSDTRKRVGAAIAATLRNEYTLTQFSIAFYWPLHGEIDLRPLMSNLCREGVSISLPAIVGKNEPLEFRRWTPNMELDTAGIWGIPTPVERDLLVPTLLLSPMLGFDAQCHRLGHGGGFYDRTLATLEPKPIAIGVAYEFGWLETIYPQNHDVSMDAIVTENGIACRDIRNGRQR